MPIVASCAASPATTEAPQDPTKDQIISALEQQVQTLQEQVETQGMNLAQAREEVQKGKCEIGQLREEVRALRDDATVRLQNLNLVASDFTIAPEIYVDVLKCFPAVVRPSNTAESAAGDSVSEKTVENLCRNLSMGLFQSFAGIRRLLRILPPAIADKANEVLQSTELLQHRLQDCLAEKVTICEMIPQMCDGHQLFNECSFPNRYAFPNQPSTRRVVMSHNECLACINASSIPCLVESSKLVIDFDSFNNHTAKSLGVPATLYQFDRDGNSKQIVATGRRSIDFLEVNFPGVEQITRLQPISSSISRWLRKENQERSSSEVELMQWRSFRACQYVETVAHIMSMLLAHIRNLDVYNSLNDQALQKLSIQKRDNPIDNCVVALWLSEYKPALKPEHKLLHPTGQQSVHPVVEQTAELTVVDNSGGRQYKRKAGSESSGTPGQKKPRIC